jgi:single-strand DNA-binding protein
MQTSSWDDKKTGEKKYRTEVVAEYVQFGPKGSSSGSGAPSSYTGGSEMPSEDMGSGAAAAGPGIEYPKEDINPDDIPF